MSRRNISDGLRYRILRRDRFRCRYCGRAASEAALHIDHIQPVSAGGRDDPANLVTACDRCNLGKGASVPAWERCCHSDRRKSIANQFEELDLDAWYGMPAPEECGPEERALAMIRYHLRSREIARQWGLDGIGREQCDPIGTILLGAFTEPCDSPVETCG